MMILYKALTILILSAQLGDFYWGQPEPANQASKHTVQIQEGCTVTGHQGAISHSKVVAF